MPRKLIPCIIFLSFLLNLDPATVSVTTSADSGAGSFREALTNANNGDTITFDTASISGTITIASEPIQLKY